MNSSHILARIHIKLGTHIDLIEPNNFCARNAIAQQEAAIQGCLKAHALEFEILLPGYFNRRAPTPLNVISDIGDAKLRRDF